MAPVIGSGRTRFQLISVEDVAACLVKSLQDKEITHRVIPLGGPEHLAYEEIIDLIIQTLKLRRLKVLIGNFHQVTSAQLAMLVMDNVTSLDMVERVFGLKPVSLS